jgi:hypothetical protein
MTICGGQRDAPRNIIPKTTFRRDAGPSTALAGYTAAWLAAGYLRLMVTAGRTVFLQTGDDGRIVAPIPQCLDAARIHSFASLLDLFGG